MRGGEGGGWLLTCKMKCVDGSKGTTEKVSVDRTQAQSAGHGAKNRLNEQRTRQQVHFLAVDLFDTKPQCFTAI